MSDHATEQHDHILQVRFQGPRLDRSAVPIYTLGQTFVALQQLIYKVHLHNRPPEEPRSIQSLTHWDREQLALQVSAHESGSDIYTLKSFLDVPLVQEFVQNLSNDVIVAILGYAAGWSWPRIRDRVKRWRQPSTDEREEAAPGADAAEMERLLVALYPQILALARRIESYDRITSMEVSCPALSDSQPALLDKAAKERILALQHQVVEGEYQPLSGIVTTMRPAQNSIDILASSGQSVSVTLSEAAFREVRYHRGEETLVRLHGHPLYRLGLETAVIREFKADTLDVLTAN